MPFTDKAKDVTDTALEKATELAEKAGEKAAELAGIARERAPEIIEKATELAGKAVETAAAGIDKATGGKYHDQIGSVSTKVGDALDSARAAVNPEHTPPAPPAAEPNPLAMPQTKPGAAAQSKPEESKPEADEE